MTTDEMIEALADDIFMMNSKQRKAITAKLHSMRARLRAADELADSLDYQAKRMGLTIGIHVRLKAFRAAGKGDV